MFLKNINIALRNLVKQKFYSFINIFGLAVGLTATILILLWVFDELSFDTFHENADNIYRFETTLHSGSNITQTTGTPALLAENLLEDYPEVEKCTRMWTPGSIQIDNNDKHNLERGFYYVDPSFVEMFSFQLKKGNEDSFAENPFSMLITESIAEKYFGDSEPLGQTLHASNGFEYTVTGVLQDVPHNSTLQFNFLVPFASLEKIDNALGDWGRFAFTTYIMLQHGADCKTFENKISNYIHKFKLSGSKCELSLISLKDVHLQGIERPTNYVSMFAAIAFVILLMACINFINLTTARSLDRSKEVGLRKVVGASKIQIIKQFYGETILIIFFALLLAIAFVELLRPLFNSITEKELTLFQFGYEFILFGLVALVIITSFLAGFYPSLFISSFRPADVLKGTVGSVGKKPGNGFTKLLIRKALVITQFAVSIILIISTIVVLDQLNYVKNKNLGYNKEYLVYMPINKELLNNYNSVKEELSHYSNIKGVTAASALPMYVGNFTMVDGWEGRTNEDRFYTNTVSVDYNFMDVLGMDLISGRKYSKEFPTDQDDSYILNEEAVKKMGVKSPLGASFSIWGMERKIIGVAKDFHFRSLHKKIEPLVIMVNPHNYNYVFARISSNDIHKTIDYIESTWRKFAPDYPFSYNFVDEALDNLYKSEERTAKVFSYFALLAILISCLGLFGLVAFTVKSKTKEIGIRKVLGAPVWSIVVLLSKQYSKWIIVANIITWPIAFYIVTKWLEDFAYKIEIGIWIFIAGGVLVLSVALVTVMGHALKAALANPVNSLRNE